MKNVIIVFLGKVNNCPPVLSLMNINTELGNKTFLVSIDIPNNTTIESLQDYLDLQIDFQAGMPILLRYNRILKCRKRIWDFIQKYYTDSTTIWVISEFSLKVLGKKLLNYHYILHFLELSEKLPLINNIPFFYIDAKKFCYHAANVVQAEYNRAYLCMVWWNLKELPKILPNKPYYYNPPVKNAEITCSKIAKKIINSLHDKKIILYQGIISAERPIENYIKAVELLGDDYAFVLMSNDKYSINNTKNFYQIPFIAPPYHLEVTSHAYIGILCYKISKNVYSPFNSLFCAPNKLYEYSLFGIPMLGNDIPGLTYPIEKNGMGICSDGQSIQSICNSIKKIEENYNQMSLKSRKFYEDTDIKAIVSDILSDKKW